MVLPAVLCLATACTGTQPPSGHHSASRKGDTASPAPEDEVAAVFFPASGAQIVDGAPLAGRMAAITTSILAACMTRHGFRMQGESAAQAGSLLTDNSEFPDIPLIMRTRSFDTGSLTAAQGPPVNLPARRQQAYAAAVRDCDAAEASLFSGVTRAVGPLAGQWATIISQIQASPPVTATLPGYRSCMEGQGVPAAQVTASSSSGSFGLFLAWETGQETHVQGQAAEATVRQHWAVIFAECAGPTVAVQERLQLARQSAFLSQHAAQVHLIARLAGQELAAATPDQASRQRA
jgi:hypothetical protein